MAASRKGRPSSTGSVGRSQQPATKKAKFDPMQQVAQVLKGTTDLPPVVQQMLVDMLPYSLGVAKDQRHKVQNAVVDMLGEIMSNIESSMEHEAAATTMKATELVEARRKCGSEIEEADAALLEAKQELAACKDALAKDSAKFQAARKSLDEASAEGKEAALRALEEARKQQKEKADAFAKALAARKEAQEAADAARAVLQNFDVEEVGLSKHMKATEARLKEFQSTVLGSFSTLRDLQAPSEADVAAAKSNEDEASAGDAMEE
mmetsp:Transcript_20055/g.46705  ORF Transcript_20055/g.46705 Transcript_20055/m.46705 type:complete len:264 (-) Transcript_20055:227-1018(-)